MFSPIFRRSFLGESSPVHFFWGTFDLAVTRLSGRRVPQAVYFLQQSTKFDSPSNNGRRPHNEMP
jgi:hypothetical protein